MVKETPFTLTLVTWQQQEQALREIRKQVFIQEQQVPETLEWDGLDEDCIHVLVRDGSGQAIATARMQDNGHIGRMAVLPNWRHRGVGSAMLDKLLVYCSQHDLQAHLDAQTHALDFYRTMGFSTVGEEFLDAGIPHRKMIHMEQAMQQEPYILGETDHQEQFDGRLDNRQIVANLIRQAHQQICIFTPDLEKHIYDDADIIRSLEQLVIRSRQTQVRVLIRDSEQAVKSGHRLIELYRRHTSSIHIHQIPEDTDNIQAAYLIVDNAGYLYKQMGNLFTGYFNANDKLKVRELSKHFDGAWERSRPDTEMRRLFI